MTGCPDHDLLLNGYLDGELDAANTIRVEQHLAGCPGCRAALDRLETVRDALRAPALRHRAPAALADRIEGLTTARFTPAVAWRPPSWLTGAIGGALAASLAFAIAVPRATTPDLAGELVAGHVRSLLADHLADVRTSDRHTVKPWFNGRTDLAPPVPELADLGFPLFGGRLDVIDGRVVPAIVYRRRLHTINLFVLPAGHGGAGSARRDGYGVVEWTQGGLAFAAVSDIDLGDLEQFRQAYASRSPR